MKKYLYNSVLAFFMSFWCNIGAYARVRIHTVNGGDDNSLLIFLIICAIGSLIIGLSAIHSGETVPGWVINIFLSSVISIILNLIIAAI